MKRNTLSDHDAAELIRQLTRELVPRMVDEPLRAGGSLADVLMLCEDVLTNVILECFKHGVDSTMPNAAETILRAICTRVSGRLREASGQLNESVFKQ